MAIQVVPLHCTQRVQLRQTRLLSKSTLFSRPPVHVFLLYIFTRNQVCIMSYQHNLIVSLTYPSTTTGGNLEHYNICTRCSQE
jgi:hypothetical protein